MRPLLVGLLAFACSADIPQLPPTPGGGGMGGGSNGSGSALSDANADMIVGFVCVLDDPRDLTSCSASAGSGITVSLPGVGSATTSADGAFTIAFPTGTNLVWSVTGTNVIPSMMGFGTSTTIFAMTVERFNELLQANGVLFDPTQGTIIGDVRHDGSAVTMVGIVASPLGVFPDTFFAVPSDTQDWPGSATSTLGTFLIAGLTTGSAGSAMTSTETLTITPSVGSAELLPNVPITAGSVTFVHVQL